MQKFLIFAPGFDANVGGVVCLHRLCHELNQIELASAALVPYKATFEITRRNFIKPLARSAKSSLKASFTRYSTHPDFDTPVMTSPGRGIRLDDYVVVYPEVVNGNPLGARNVVRWLLYPPGGITGKIKYGPGELYVPFSSAIGRFELPGSTTLTDQLKIVHYPLDIYSPTPDGTPKSGTAYAVRKGSAKPLVHHPDDAVCIDGLSHEEIAVILQRVRTFVSYDSYTAYSLFAAALGCESVVIPDDGVSLEMWYPDPEDRYGISYGWEQLDHARATRHLVRERMLAEQGRNPERARRFVDNISDYFGEAI
jgi:hypothetical protein